jgi:hypothetical protein
MPDKLTKKKNSRNSTLRSFKDDDSFRDSEDNVTYVSTNMKTGTEFIGSAPPNSRLAATLAQVAAAVQADNLPRYKEGPARLTSGASPRGQIQAAPATTPVRASYRDERNDYPYRGYATEYRDDQEGYEQPQGVNDAREQNYPRNQERPTYSRPIVSQQRSDDEYSTATRHELDQKVAYHTKSANGELCLHPLGVMKRSCLTKWQGGCRNLM